MSHWCLLKVNVKFIYVFKSGLWFKIRQSHSEISHFFWLNSCKIDVFRKHRKIQYFKISPVFNRKHLIMMKNDQNNSFMLKIGDILEFWIFRCFQKTTILQELSQKNWDISEWDWRILNPRPDLETSIDSTSTFKRDQCDIRTNYLSKMPRKWTEGGKN